jgi:hypothetical protein
MLLRLLAALAPLALLVGQADAKQPTSPSAPIVRSLTPGFMTRLSYPASLVCPKNITRFMPERATRVVATDFAHLSCRVDSEGRLASCTKADEAGSTGLYFPLGAALMAEKCRLAIAPGVADEMQFEFKFETTARSVR